MKNIARFCFLISILAYGPLSHARLFLDVSVINKKGIDIGLTLGSELHSREEVKPTEDIRIGMKSGLSVLLRASFNDKVESATMPITKESDPKIDLEKDKKQVKKQDKKEVKKVAPDKKKTADLKDTETEVATTPLRVIGPSSKIVIRGRVIGIDGSIVKDFFKEPLIVTLGETAIVTHSQNSQLVEIKIKPHIE